MTGTGNFPRSNRRASRFEYSAGGVARDGDLLLMVKVQTLDGNQLWTFPKGHIEPGETSAQAAVREVVEETGFRCEITGPLDEVRYWFERDGIVTQKTVTWYLMRALEQAGLPDPKEVLEAQWISLRDAGTLIRYKSDRKIYSRLTQNTANPL